MDVTERTAVTRGAEAEVTVGNTMAVGIAEVTVEVTPEVVAPSTIVQVGVHKLRVVVNGTR